MFDLPASPDIVNCTGNSYTPMASRSMPTAKTFVADCNQRSQFESDDLHTIERARSTRAAYNNESGRLYTDRCGYGSSQRSSTCTGPSPSPVNTTTTAAMTTSGYATTWTQRHAGSPAHAWTRDSAIPARMHANTASMRGVYGEFGVNVKEEYSDPSDYSSDTCSDFDWTSRSAAVTGASSSSGLADVRHGRGHMNEAVQSMAGRHRRSSHDKSIAEDEERRRIRRERNKLAAARCRQRRVDLTNQLLAETESLEDEKMQLEKEISNLQRQRHQLEFVLDSHASRCRHLVGPAHSHVTTTTTTGHSPSSRPFAAITAPAKAETERPARGAAGRPSSLSLSVPAASGGGGGLTTTPMTFTSLGLDCMVDGHTGLTPITGQRPHDDMALHPDGMSPTTLMTL